MKEVFAITNLIKAEPIDRIKQRRLELDLSYQRLADKTGINKSTLHRYESGTIKNLPASKITALATALKTTPEYIVGWDSNETNSSINKDEQKIKEKLLKLIRKHQNLFGHFHIEIEKLSNKEQEDLASNMIFLLNLISYKYRK